jgi:uncharacterized protein (TIGR02145 family)
MSETKEIGTVTSVNIVGSVLTIYTRFIQNITKYLGFFIKDASTVVGDVPFSEGELGYTKDGMPNFNSFLTDKGELLILDDSVEEYFIDGNGDLISGEILNKPVAINGITIDETSFIIKWNVVDGATGYYFDIAYDQDFNRLVSGYQNKDAGNVTEYRVEGLVVGTYFYRVRSYNEEQISESSNIISIVAETQNLVDLDGNIYTTIIIGNYEIMVECLKTTKYVDGSSIPNRSVEADWMAEDGSPGHDGAYCWYDNIIENKNPYGAIYDWYAITNPKGLINGQFSRGGVPSTGWRVPSEADFDAINILVGGQATSGLKLREAGTTHWYEPNEATNDYGFSLLGGGYRCGADGIFWNGNDNPLAPDSLSFVALWTTTESEIPNWAKCFWTINNGNEFKVVASEKREGNYVRCIREIV